MRVWGLLSDTTLGLLDELTNRLPANARQRFTTFARMKLSATIALGTARLIKERLPIRIGSDGRVLPTGAAAVPLLGPPPRGPSLMRRHASFLAVSQSVSRGSSGDSRALY